MDAEQPTKVGRLAAKRAWSAELLLAYQSLGVVYGDVATAPLYVFKSAFAGGDIEHSAGNKEIYGVLSLVFWTLTLIPLIKYVFLVLRADDHGEGGTFALYSLICRRVRAGLLPGGGGELAVQPRERGAPTLEGARRPGAAQGPAEAAAPARPPRDLHGHRRRRAHPCRLRDLRGVRAQALAGQ
ncbi:hypothetical protein QYE76_069997 [Lolium multiflorum]|uniref:K+ potassium transporter integral membrane domain-containing protein n=1 Tax=Lolium multiflorum TaxID=4521 RepID=A0AAD8SHF5_LOLMU|nr:hypothetical protein QYE76_069997 [Lolium multiflorum]